MLVAVGDYSCGSADRSEEQSFPAGTSDGWQRQGEGEELSPTSPAVAGGVQG